MRILLIEDSQKLQYYIAKGLRNEGYAVDAADNGEDGLWLAESNDYDVIILDLMLPKIDGLTVLRRLREQGNDTNVLILTAKDTVDDRVRGLGLGADDYLVKPFDLKELLARVQSLIRRGYGIKRPRIIVGDLKIDLAAKSVSRAGRPIELKPREYALLEYLALRPGEVVSRSDIEAHIYDERVAAMSNVVDSAICILRRKLGETGRSSLIQTRRGQGYCLEVPDATKQSANK